VLRFSLAENNDTADLVTLLQALPEAVHRARAAAAFA
jgi:cysteine sulfinate desulfinase/cysteine desulfurase-like protein